MPIYPEIWLLVTNKICKAIIFIFKELCAASFITWKCVLTYRSLQACCQHLCRVTQYCSKYLLYLFLSPSTIPSLLFSYFKIFSALSSGVHSLLQKQQNNKKCLQILEWLKKFLKSLKQTQFPMSGQPVVSLLKLKNPACIHRKNNPDEPRNVNKSLEHKFLIFFSLLYWYVMILL